MKNKSQQSLEAAQKLISLRKPMGYNSSIHCSYYAVLQYMKYMLANTRNTPLSYEQQDISSQSSHEYLLTEITNRFDSYNERRNFTHLFRLLKKNRVEADYTTKDFSEFESLKCKENAEAAIKKIKRNLGDL